MIKNTLIADNIKTKLTKELSIHYLEIIDNSEKHAGHNQTSEGGHYAILLVSNIFNDMKLINRHKLVYKILNNMIGKEIHAISIKAYNKKEYENFSNLEK